MKTTIISRRRNKEEISGLNLSSSQRILASVMNITARPHPTTSSIELMKLAAVAVDLNVRVRSANMPVAMQERAFRYTRSLLLGVGVGHDNCKAAPANINHPKPSPTQIALAIKKEFDASYGLAWHCIVGKSFGSFVTHSPGGFLYFSIDNLSFLLFKTEVRPLLLR